LIGSGVRFTIFKVFLLKYEFGILINILALRTASMGKKLFYKGLIFREFYFSGTLSCADLSERIGKSIPLTMKILNELIEDGYVKESGYAPSSGGRRPVM